MERVLLLNIIGNSQSNIMTLKLMDDVKRDCAFSQEEITEFKMDTVINGDKSAMTWDTKFNATTKEIEIPELVEKFIEKKLVDMNTREQMSRDYIRLYEMFVEKKWDI
jgi:Na+-transporting NADH:ubiquinone oxidoreductase subunit NqrC